MKRAAENMCVGKLSGAVGTYADIDPYVEEYVCKKLGLKVHGFEPVYFWKKDKSVYFQKVIFAYNI